MLPLAFKAMRHKDEIEEVMRLLGYVFKEAQPAIAEFKRVWPALKPKLESLAGTFFPDMQLSLADDGVDLDVSWIQETLNKYFGEKLTVDGDYGEATREAIKRFQGKYMGPEKVDGWVGHKTMLAFFTEIVKQDMAKAKK